MGEKLRKGFVGVFALLLLSVSLLGACTKEKIVEVPVEKVVEKEVIKEVPVEKVVEKEVIKEAPAEQVLKIGIEYDLTGPVGPVGVRYKPGQDDYLRWLNEEKGGINGIKVEMVWFDAGMESERILSGFDDVVDAGVLVYTTRTSLGNKVVNAKVEAAKMPVIAGPTTVECVTSPYYYALYVPYPANSTAFIDWIVEEWDKWDERNPRLAFVNQDVFWPRMMTIPQVYDYAKSVDVDIVAEVYTPANPVDTKPQLLAAQNAGADFIMLGGHTTLASAALKDAKRLGMWDKVRWAVAVPCSLADTAEMIGDELVEGVIWGYARSMRGDGSPLTLECEDLYEKYHGTREVPADWYIDGVIFTKMQVEVLRKALEKVPYEELTRESVMEYGVWRMEDVDTGGFTAGPITWSEDRWLGGDETGLSIWKNGELVRLPKSYPLHHLFEKMVEEQSQEGE